MHTELESLVQGEQEQLKKLKEIVVRAIDEEKLISEKLYQFEDTHPSLKSRLADKIASFGGSWSFIFSFFIILAVWIGVNIYLLNKAFDPYPFILLNLFLSTVAALQAPVIMMSRNRKEEKDRQRSINDYMVNLKSEIELRNLHEKMDLLISEQMKSLYEIQKLQLELIEKIKTIYIQSLPKNN